MPARELAPITVAAPAPAFRPKCRQCQSALKPTYREVATPCRRCQGTGTVQEQRTALASGRVEHVSAACPACSRGPHYSSLRGVRWGTGLTSITSREWDGGYAFGPHFCKSACAVEFANACCNALDNRVTARMVEKGRGPMKAVFASIVAAGEEIER